MLKPKRQYFGHLKNWLIGKDPDAGKDWREEKGRKRLKGGEGEDRGWDGGMVSPTWWTWVWINSRSWRWTGRPGVLQPMGTQRVGHSWVTELNWVESRLLWLQWKSWDALNSLFPDCRAAATQVEGRSPCCLRCLLNLLKQLPSAWFPGRHTTPAFTLSPAKWAILWLGVFKPMYFQVFQMTFHV